MLFPLPNIRQRLARDLTRGSLIRVHVLAASRRITFKVQNFAETPNITVSGRRYGAHSALGVGDGGAGFRVYAAIQSAERTGRPLGDEAFTARLEQSLGRTLARQKPGRKPEGAVERQEVLP